MTTPKKIYPKVIELEHFQPEMLDLYWRFIAERQNAYVRRVLLDQPRPWTKDPIINSEFITNMYRELDPGTAYVITDILSIKKPEDLVFNVLLYRLMGSQASTHRLIKTTAAKFKLAPYLKAIENVENGKLFGDAYRVAGYESWGGSSKRENVGIMFEALAKEMPTIVGKIKATTNPQELYEVIFSVPGFGEFLAHQISVDLLYTNNDGVALVPFGENVWAKAGPGAKRGIQTLLHSYVSPKSNLVVMEWLRDHQEEEFAKRDIDMKYLVGHIGLAENEIATLSLCNIQSTLCEFYKYARIWVGEQKAVRRYVPSLTPTEQPKVMVNNPASVLECPRLTYDRPKYVPGTITSADIVPTVVPQAIIDSEQLGEVSATEPSGELAALNGQTLSFSSPDGQTTFQLTINVYMNGAPS